MSSPIQSPVPRDKTPSLSPHLYTERLPSPLMHIPEETTQPIQSQTTRRVSFDSHSYEIPSDSSVNWDFNGPLVPGPIPQSYVLDESHLIFKTAGR